MTDGADDPIAVELEYLFGASDTDHDGFVDWSDYERLISRYLNGYGIPAEDRRAHALRAAYQTYWSELLQHVNGVDRLSKEQFVVANRAAGADTSRFTMAEAVPQAIFDVMDTDADDAISKPEYKVFLEAWGVSDLEALNVFLELDADDHGESAAANSSVPSVTSSPRPSSTRPPASSSATSNTRAPGAQEG